MDNKRTYLGIDVGEQRVGLAIGDSIGRIAIPLRTIAADESILEGLRTVVAEADVTDLVVGLPRNQSGDITAQTERVKVFADEVLAGLGLPIHWQDESVTSVIAEERLMARKKPYVKGDIDAEAASIILQDFLERV
ncbi:MAG TPA: Holliday junction resolvase RuvX [Candidatus Saccharimonadales bacterium]|nr:Holliday junction resolvase RuvX [Candidatus Saccharimonadales bacterium]